MKTAIAMAVFGALAVGCLPATQMSAQTSTASIPTARLAQYRTFSFASTKAPSERHRGPALSVDVERRMRELVGSALRERGYVEDTNEPNFVVRLDAGIGQAESTAPLYDADPSRSSDIEVSNVQRIEITVFDAYAQKEVWRGSATSRSDLAGAIDAALLQRGVQDALATFPVHGLATATPAGYPLASGDTGDSK